MSGAMADSVVRLEDPAGRLSNAASGKADAVPAPAPVPPAVRPALTARRSAALLFQAARRLVRTHAFRLAGLYFLVFAVSVLGVLLFVYWTSADFVERQTEATLDAEITGLAEQYAQRGLSGLIQIVAARSAGDRGDGMLYLVTNPDGRPLAGNISGWPAGLPVRSGPLSLPDRRDREGPDRDAPGARRAVCDPGRLPPTGRARHQRRRAFRDRIKTTLLWSGLVALGIGLVGGTVMSRNMLRRVEQVNRTAERVIAGNLSDRVPRRGTNDEFDQLAANLNSMLDQIERLMSGMREVTDNVAHDLKTPLARLRARLELALAWPGRSACPRRGDPRRDRRGRPAARNLQRAAQHRRGRGRRRSIGRRAVGPRRDRPRGRSSCTSRWPKKRALRLRSTARPGR